MARTVLTDQFHLSGLAPRGLAGPAYLAVRRTVDRKRFQADLRHAVREVARRYPALSRVRFRLSR